MPSSSRRATSVTTAPPSATAEASCGQVWMVSLTSNSDATSSGEIRDPSRIRQDVGDLLSGRQPAQLIRVHLPEQPVQHRPVRLEVEAFDVDHAAVAGLHQHGDPQRPRPFPYRDLGEQVVALLDEQVQLAPVAEEGVEVALVQAVAEELDVDVGIRLRHRTGGDDGLGDPEVVHAGA